jgi:membrane-bound metal-dependent hydrolase YbcI (DUF457 family)
VDIVTHGMMGVILASPFASTHPVSAAAFAFGCVLPDLDALSRCLGKRAFMAIHQSHTHALPYAVLAGVALWLGLRGSGFYEPWAAPALVAGMWFHSLLDYSNTYGITLFAPFSARRFCAEWVFFIDSVVLAASGAALAGIAWQQHATGELGWRVQAAYGLLLVVYWPLKACWRWRAGRVSPPGTLALLPSALVPWRYLGCAREGERMRTFRVNALSGSVAEEGGQAILDARYRDVIERVPEFHVMRHLSPAYHVVEANSEQDGTTLVCRDLRTRNFDTTFGRLDLRLDAAGALQGVVFHV